MILITTVALQVWLLRGSQLTLQASLADSLWLYKCGYYNAADTLWLYKYLLADSLWLYKCGYYKAAPPPTFLAWNRAPASGRPSCRYFARLYMTIPSGTLRKEGGVKS